MVSRIVFGQILQIVIELIQPFKHEFPQFVLLSAPLFGIVFVKPMPFFIGSWVHFCGEIGEAPLDFAGGAFLAHEKQQWSNELYVYRLIFWKPFSPKVNRTLPKQKVPPYVNSKLEHHPSKPKATISFRFHGQSPQWPNHVFLVPCQTSPRRSPPMCFTSNSADVILQGVSVTRELKERRFTWSAKRKKQKPILVGGFNPFGEYESNWDSSPNREDNIENIWHHHLELMELRSWWWWMWQSTDITIILCCGSCGKCFATHSASSHQSNQRILHDRNQHPQSDGYGIESGPSDFFVA